MASLVLLVGGALAMDAAESGGRGPIADFPDALWWAASTMTTVGYGDAYPVTLFGRGIAIVLMVGGIAFFGVLAANLAAFFVDRTRLGDAAAAGPPPGPDARSTRCSPGSRRSRALAALRRDC
jgi:voltage-gated potassium channel